MEVYRPTNPNSYRQIIQQGSGEIDRYIYNQEGEGIGSFFGNLFRSSIPVISRAIKGGVKLAKPHLHRAAADIITTGSKRLINKISDNSVPKRKYKKIRSKL